MSKKHAEMLRQRASKVARLQRLDGKTVDQIATELKTHGSGFLRSPEWTALRAKVIAKYGGKCMCCGTVPARGVNVDHIKPRRDFPELALVEDNLQVLCPPCNKYKGNKHHTDYRRSAAVDSSPIAET